MGRLPLFAGRIALQTTAMKSWNCFFCCWCCLDGISYWYCCWFLSLPFLHLASFLPALAVFVVWLINESAQQKISAPDYERVAKRIKSWACDHQLGVGTDELLAFPFIFPSFSPCALLVFLFLRAWGFWMSNYRSHRFFGPSVFTCGLHLTIWARRKEMSKQKPTDFFVSGLITCYIPF
jgi:hypothetical protein